MPELVILLIIILAIVVLGFLYLIGFQGAAAQFSAQMVAELQKIYDAPPDGKERCSLILISQYIGVNQVRSVIVRAEGFVQLSPPRYVLPGTFADYAGALGHDALRDRQTFGPDTEEKIAAQTIIAFEQALLRLEVEGWRLVLDVPFSPIDRIVYLQR